MRHHAWSARFTVFGVACLLGLAAGAAQAQDLPSGKEVLDRYIEATGGRDTYENVQSRVSRSTIEAPMAGIKGVMTIYQKVPDQAYIRTEIEGIGIVEQGADGANAWERSDVMGARLLQGQEKESLLRSTNIHVELNPEQFYEEITTLGVEELDGKPAYKVKLTTPAGAQETRYYDQESGLLIKSEATQKSERGEINVVSTLSDYKEFDGMKIPTVLTQQVMGQTIKLTINDVEHNVEIDESKFNMPADVKALLDKQSTQPATQPG